MNLKKTAILGTGSVMVAMALWFAAHQPEAGKIPKDKITDMRFPRGLKATGDPLSGLMCHQIIVKGHDGKPDETLLFHQIEHKDFRTMTEEQKKAAIIADTQADLEGAGVACGPVAPPFFSEAIADSVKRCDGCGTDCWITSCDSTFVGPYCVLGGSTCVISFICCGGANGGCPASCDA